MDPGKRRGLAIVVGTLTVVGWLMMMISFWTPVEFARMAMLHTALGLMIPGAVGSALTWAFWHEMVRTQPTPALRCTDCSTKILNVAGTTIGDQIEGELMSWHPPETSPFNRQGH